MKKLLLLFCLIFLLRPVGAQQINADSLLDVVIAQNKTAKISPPISVDSLTKAFSATRDIYTRTRLAVEILMGSQSATAAQQAFATKSLLANAQKVKDEGGVAIATTLVGYTMYNGGNNAAGLKQMHEGLKLAETLDDKGALSIIYNLLGVCNTNLNLEKLYFQKALQFSKATGDKLSMGFELGNFFYIYWPEHKTDSALYYVKRSFEIAVKNNFDILTVNDLLNLGKLQSDPVAEFKYYKTALHMPRVQSNAELMERAAAAMATWFRKAKQVDSALYYAHRAYNVSNDLLIGRKLHPAGVLASLYKGRNADSALKYTEISYALRDSMFSIDKIEHAHSLALAEQQKQEEIAAQKAADEANLRLYVLAVVITFLIVLAVVLWRNSKRSKKANKQIQNAIDELKTTQTQLIQSEKMASLGELTAGIAHEIQNPLNFVNNFSEVSIELLEEMKAESGKPKAERNEELENELIDDLSGNLEKIRHHGRRADGIVKGMLEHSRASTGHKEPTDLNKLADEYLRLAYHGLRAKDKSFNAELITRFDEKLPLANVISQDIGRVLLNLFTNAFYATQQRAKASGAEYKPIVEVNTFTPPSGGLGVLVKDNGSGIPDAIKDKIMQPFFTTKPTGEGTGLGLSLSYDIVVKGHGGKIGVVSKENEFTEFTVTLPL